MQLKRSRRAGWEYVVLIFVVASSMILALALYSKRDQVAKERLLIQELGMLRNYVIAYTLEHREIPKNPWSLPAGQAGLVPGGWSNQDPFGHPYQYNPKTGWVRTTTKRYVHW